MIKIQRHARIMNILENFKSVTIAKLSKEFKCSEETIRKDLKELEQDGKLIKTHGGAYIEDSNNRGMPHDIRETILKEEKVYMANIAMKYINNNSTIAIDSSTTCIEIVKKIIENDFSVTIITNSIHVANMCSYTRNIKIILLPGELNKKNKSVVGYYTTKFLKYIKTDISFVSFPTIDLNQGYGDNTINELNVRKEMIKNTRKSIVLLDNTKFNDTNSIFFTKIENTDVIISNEDIDDKWKEFLNEMNIEFLYK